MTFFNKSTLTGIELSKYAVADDFRGVFEDGMASLYQLAFILTAEHLKAEQVFVASFEDAVKSKQVFNEWSRRWATRTVIKNAIRALNPYPIQPSAIPVAVLVHSGGRSQAHTPSLVLNAILALKNFDRFVYVMTTLEGYPEHDCALLMNATHRQVREARVRAMQMVSLLQPTQDGAALVPCPHETPGPPNAWLEMPHAKRSRDGFISGRTH
jgi:hypothetical protein